MLASLVITTNITLRLERRKRRRKWMR